MAQGVVAYNGMPLGSNQRQRIGHHNQPRYMHQAMPGHQPMMNTPIQGNHFQAHVRQNGYNVQQQMHMQHTNGQLSHSPTLQQNPRTAQFSPIYGQDPSKPLGRDFNSNPHAGARYQQPMNWQINTHHGHQQNQQYNGRNLSPTPRYVSNQPQMVQQSHINNQQQYNYQPAVARRRMSSSSQHSDYSASSGMSNCRQDNWSNQRLNPTPPLGQNNGTKYIPNPENMNSNVARVSPGAMGISPGQQWGETNQGTNYSNLPSPLSSISSESSPPNNFQHPTKTFEAVQFRQPRPPPLMAGIPLQQLPPSGYMGHIPGAVAGATGNDWEVICLGATVKLRNYELWKNFDDVVMEMVISKHGRRMFPVLEYDIQGLHPHKLYSVFVDFVLCSNYVWKFVEQKWQASGLAPLDEDAFERNHRICVHPDSPATGDTWNKRGVTFSKMKLSNHLHSDGDKLSLKSLHKYQPRLHIVEVNPRDPTIQSNLRTFIVPKTQFMTVTLYHNTDVAQLKINLNPFARCFRDKDLPSVGSPSDLTQNSPSSTSSCAPSLSPGVGNEEGKDVAPNPQSFDPQKMLRVSNPVSQQDLNIAKNYMQAQLNTMSQLVQCQKSVFLKESTPVSQSTPSGHCFSKELEDLLSNVENATPPSCEEDATNIDELKRLLGENNEESTPTDNGKSTVHHKPPPGEEEKKAQAPKNVSTKETEDSRETYELSQVDRVFPPNAVAPVSNQLPFDPEEIKKSSDRSANGQPPLPAFFGCSFYREQAAAAQIKNPSSNPDDSNTNPVIYLPPHNALSKTSFTKETSSVKPSEHARLSTHTVVSTINPETEEATSQESSSSDSSEATKEVHSPQVDDLPSTMPPTVTMSTPITSHQISNSIQNILQISQSGNHPVCDLAASNTNDFSPSNMFLNTNSMNHNSYYQQPQIPSSVASNFMSFPLPTLSPTALNDFLGEEIPNLNKRKFSYEDEDDDVFTITDNALIKPDYMSSVTKRQCLATNGVI